MDCEEMLRCYPAVTEPVLYSAKDIIWMVALKHGLKPSQLTGRTGFRKVIAARYEAMRLIHEHKPLMSSVHIGRIFDRDHSTVLYALGKLAKRKKRHRGNGADDPKFHDAGSGAAALTET